MFNIETASLEIRRAAMRLGRIPTKWEALNPHLTIEECRSRDLPIARIHYADTTQDVLYAEDLDPEAA